MIKNILFVCTGNTCRSPMAEFMLKDALKKKGVKGVRVASAGLCADEYGTINELAKKRSEKTAWRLENSSPDRLTAEWWKKPTWFCA